MKKRGGEEVPVTGVSDTKGGNGDRSGEIFPTMLSFTRPMFVSHFLYTIAVVKFVHSQEMKGIKEVVIPCRLEGAAGICCRYCV